MNKKILVNEMKIRNYSRKTIKSYVYINERFLKFTGKSAREVGKRDIEQYMVHLYDKGLASATRHLICSALKFYYESVLKRRFHLKYPKKSSKLGNVLSKDEIFRMIKATENPKHRLLIQLMYGSGLRVGEAVKVKTEDIDVENMILHVKKGKGRKDRLVHLSIRFLREFNWHIKGKRGFVFPSWSRLDKHITIRTAQQIVKNALKKASIEKKAHCHTLRASYATQLIREGVGIEHIQPLMGHSRIDTTRGYIRLVPDDIVKIKSPLD